jgi:heme exporter protein C
MIAFLVVFVASILYLWRRDERYDLVAAAAAEVGVVLTGLTLALGSIWGKPTWGVWWTWDPRLTSTAILFMIYAGYLALRGFTDDAGAAGALERGHRHPGLPERADRLHVGALVAHAAPDPVDAGDAGPAYAWGLRLNAIAFLLVFVYFVGRRYYAARVERAAERKRGRRSRLQHGRRICLTGLRARRPSA